MTQVKMTNVFGKERIDIPFMSKEGFIVFSGLLALAMLIIILVLLWVRGLGQTHKQQHTAKLVGFHVMQAADGRDLDQYLQDAEQAAQLGRMLERVQREQDAISSELQDLRAETGRAELHAVLSTEVSRLPISCSRQEAYAGLQTFTNFLIDLESRGDGAAISSSNALGYSQFIVEYRGKFHGGPLDTAFNRYQMYSRAHGIDVPEWISKERFAENPLRFLLVPRDAQAALVIVNIAQESGNDEMLAKAACGDANAAQWLYAYKHHRAPEREPMVWTNLAKVTPRHYPQANS